MLAATHIFFTQLKMTLAKSWNVYTGLPNDLWWVCAIIVNLSRFWALSYMDTVLCMDMHRQFGHVYYPWHLTSGKMYQDLPLFIVGRVWEWGCSHLHKTCITHKIHVQLNYVPKIEVLGVKIIALLTPAKKLHVHGQ